MKIVASLTTLPDRYDKLYNTLKILHNQTIKLDAIYLTLPYIAKRLNKPYPKLPNKIKKLCTIVRCKEDYGPICKLYGALVCENDPNTIIITVDDDCVYPNNLVELLVNKSILRPNAAITGIGVLVKCGLNFFAINSTFKECKPYGNLISYNIPDCGRKVDIVHGVSGVLYKRCFFPSKNKIYDDLLHYTKDIDIFKSDDILISGYLSKKNIKRYTFRDLGVITHNATEDALSGDVLKMLNTFDKALHKCRYLGMFKTFEECSLFDSCVFKVPVVILCLILIIFFIILLVLTWK